MSCYVCRILRQKFWLLMSFLLCTIVVSVYRINGPHQRVCIALMSVV